MKFKKERRLGGKGIGGRHDPMVTPSPQPMLMNTHHAPDYVEKR
jgi:hypothetical protein